MPQYIIILMKFHLKIDVNMVFIDLILIILSLYLENNVDWDDLKII